MGAVSLVPTSEELARRAARGDAKAFDELVERHTPALYALCRRMLGDATEAEDRVQEAFLRAFRNLQRFDPSRPFLPWLTRIAHNACVDSLRARRSWHPWPEQGVAAPSEPLRLDAADALAPALETLSARQRAVLHCKYVLGMTAPDIARQLDTTPGNVRVCLHRAIAALRRRLSP
ncbi:MAG: sigma-70 family RNA polymerase sigma factor [Planctomycetota bacterium]|nr:MAG: sigma-70 family RNA polymerase sigma factor [Planctomycetota bacterium]